MNKMINFQTKEVVETFHLLYHFIAYRKSLLYFEGNFNEIVKEKCQTNGSDTRCILLQFPQFLQILLNSNVLKYRKKAETCILAFDFCVFSGYLQKLGCTKGCVMLFCIFISLSSCGPLRPRPWCGGA